MASNEERLLQELVRDEGLVLTEYKDHLGYSTIGVGRLIDKRKGGGITEKEALYLLANDVAKVYAQLDKELPWWRTLSPARQRVLANMAFNLGIKGLLGFKNTLAMIKAGDYNKAADGMLNSLWAKQVGPRAKRLSDLMRAGQ